MTIQRGEVAGKNPPGDHPVAWVDIPHKMFHWTAQAGVVMGWEPCRSSPHPIKSFGLIPTRGKKVAHGNDFLGIHGTAVVVGSAFFNLIKNHTRVSGGILILGDMGDLL